MRQTSCGPSIFKLKRRDGYVSLEVSPYLAHKTRETIDEARRLWKTVARENIMIKVPGTPEGLPAIRELIGSGINVNITLLFAQDVYEKVAEAFIAGLEDFAKRDGDVSRVASVASFFVSRIDALVDGKIAELIKNPRLRDRSCFPKRASRQSCHCQCQAHLSTLQENLQRSALASAGRNAAPPLSACSGPAPARRIPLTAIFSMWKN